MTWGVRPAAIPPTARHCLCIKNELSKRVLIICLLISGFHPLKFQSNWQLQKKRADSDVTVMCPANNCRCASENSPEYLINYKSFNNAAAFLGRVRCVKLFNLSPTDRQ